MAKALIKKYHPNSKEELKALCKDESIYLGDIDTSKITDMSELFYYSKRKDFSGIETWDTSHVINMDSMFYCAVSFNQDISRWDTSHVTNMNSMFYYAKSFNQDISRWDVSNVVSVNRIFNGARCFCKIPISRDKLEDIDLETFKSAFDKEKMKDSLINNIGDDKFYYVSLATENEYWQDEEFDGYAMLNAVSVLVENKDLTEDKDGIYFRKTESIVDGPNMDDIGFAEDEVFCFNTKNKSLLFYTNEFTDETENFDYNMYYVNEKLEGILSGKDLSLISSLNGKGFFDECVILDNKHIKDFQKLIVDEMEVKDVEVIKNKDVLSTIQESLHSMNKQKMNQTINKKEENAFMKLSVIQKDIVVKSQKKAKEIGYRLHYDSNAKDAQKEFSRFKNDAKEHNCYVASKVNIKVKNKRNISHGYDEGM